jgi:hypothetical protein
MRDNGHPMELVPSKVWHESLRGVLATHREFMPLVMGVTNDPKRGMDSNIFSMQFDASRLRAALAGTGIVCPRLDRELIGTYLTAMLRDSAR